MDIILKSEVHPTPAIDNRLTTLVDIILKSEVHPTPAIDNRLTTLVDIILKSEVHPTFMVLVGTKRGGGYHLKK